MSNDSTEKIHETPLRQLWRFLFYDATTHWFEPGQPTTWHFSWFKIWVYVVVAIFAVFVFWTVSAVNEKAERSIDTFAAECAERQGGVYEIGGEKICVDKTGRIVWLDSQRANQ